MEQSGQQTQATWFQKINPTTKRMFVSLGVLILLIILFAALQWEKFTSQMNIINIIHQVVTYAIVGFGLTFVLVSGGTDLSAGAALALAGMVSLFLISRGVPIWLSLILTLFVGVFMGGLNGFSVMKLGVLPFIATLGTQWVFRGLTNVITDGRPVYTSDLSPADNANFYKIGGGRLIEFVGGGESSSIASPFLRFLADIPISVLIALVYGILLYFILAKTPFGRKIYACGSNIEAARLSGINVVRTRIGAYIICSISAVIAGIITASRVTSAQPLAGQGYELEAIAASVLGGVAMSGGEGGIINTVIGALIMGVLRNGLNLNGFNSYWQMVVIGFVIVLAVASEAYRNRKFT
ncbi:MAG: ABC transporter permease [Christensenellales bacterium]|jgi:ribose transport system permease protein